MDHQVRTADLFRGRDHLFDVGEILFLLRGITHGIRSRARAGGKLQVVVFQELFDHLKISVLPAAIVKLDIVKTVFFSLCIAFFIGKFRIDQVDMERFIGYAFVISHDGDITAEDAHSFISQAREAALSSGNTECDCYNRILVKGDATMTEDAAKVFAENRIMLFGNESQTVGPLDAPMAVHLIMLGAEIVLLEGIRLGEVPDGVYLLNSAPINLGGSDGAPCRAVLLKL